MVELNEKEHLLLQEIARRPEAAQRELSQACQLSLGLTNLLLKRLLQNGFITVHNLNMKKKRYILTSRGLAERAKASSSYAARLHQEFRKMSATIRSNVLEEYGRGLRQFVIVAPGDVEDLIREVLVGLELPGASYSYEPDPAKAVAGANTVFTAVPIGGNGSRRVIPILEPYAPKRTHGSSN